MAINLSDDEKDIWKIVQAIKQVIQGRGDFIGRVTLTPNATLTVVSFINCSAGCHIDLTAETPNAAAAQATTYVPQATVVQGGFTIRHANNAQTDRTFSFACIGG